MASHILSFRSFLRSLFLLLGGGCLLPQETLAQDLVTPTPLKSANPEIKDPMPPAPADGILDGAEIFTPQQKSALAAKLNDFKKANDFQIYLATYTFVYGEDANQRAERLGAKWLNSRQGAVIVFDKGGKEAAPVIGMAWQQDDQLELPSRTILGILLGAKSAAEAKPINRPDERLQAAAEEVMAGYGRIRPIVEEGRRAARIRQLKILGGVIGIMIVSLCILAFTQRFQRKLEQRNSESYLFPHVEIAPRYGAPYGGGVVVQMHYGQSAALPSSRA